MVQVDHIDIAAHAVFLFDCCIDSSLKIFQTTNKFETYDIENES